MFRPARDRAGDQPGALRHQQGGAPHLQGPGQPRAHRECHQQYLQSTQKFSMSFRTFLPFSKLLKVGLTLNSQDFYQMMFFFSFFFFLPHSQT